ncbi:MAG: hypothetical protein IJ467_07225 [Bacteroidaceae bacterium]|nr:hypothetical protein [Bacteroidaceae bacterium]
MYNIKEESIALINNVRIGKLNDAMLLSYIMSRGIDCDIAKQECVELQYELYGKPCNSIGFLNNSGGYIINGTMSKGCFGEQDMTIVEHRNEHEPANCYLFEDYLMYLSFLTLCKMGVLNIEVEQSFDYIILNSATNIPKLLSILDRYSSVHSFLGNGKVGQVLNEVITGAFSTAVQDEMLRYLPHNNLNVYLRNIRFGKS